MRKPLASEETAFHYVLGTVAYFAPIVAAAWIATWLGVVVFVVMTIAAILVIRGGRKPEAPSEPPPLAAVEDTPEPPRAGRPGRQRKGAGALVVPTCRRRWRRTRRRPGSACRSAGP